ncbi:dnaj domain containing protein [Hordeum vulgare]|nr:dnaj domain containing protein [Hordeum vulgare]
MQAAARRAAAAAASASAGFHSTAAVLSKSTPRIRFNVREKRADAKSALKNILLNGGPCQERSNKQQMRQHKVGGRSKVRPGSGNNPYSKDRLFARRLSSGTRTNTKDLHRLKQRKKFRRCVEAYNALSGAFKSSSAK